MTVSRTVTAALITVSLLAACTDNSAKVEHSEAQISELGIEQDAADVAPTPMLMLTPVATPAPTPTRHPCAFLVETRNRARLDMANYENSAEWEAAEAAAASAVGSLSNALQDQMDYHPDVYIRDEAWALSQIFAIQILRELHAMSGGVLLTDDQGFEFFDSGMSLSEFLQKKGKQIEQNDHPEESVRRIREAAFRAEVAEYNARIARRAGLRKEEREWSDVSRNWDSIADELGLLQSAHLAAANSVETCLEENPS